MIIHGKRYSYQKFVRGYRGSLPWGQSGKRTPCGQLSVSLALFTSPFLAQSRAPSLAMQSELGVVRLNSNPSRRPGCLRRHDGLKTDRKSMTHPLATIRTSRETKQRFHLFCMMRCTFLYAFKTNNWKALNKILLWRCDKDEFFQREFFAKLRNLAASKGHLQLAWLGHWQISRIREQRDIRVGYQRGFRQVDPQGSIYSSVGSKLYEYIITEGFWSNRLDDVDTLTNYFHVFIRAAIVTCEMCQQRVHCYLGSSYSSYQDTLKMTVRFYCNNDIEFKPKKYFFLIIADKIVSTNFVNV